MTEQDTGRRRREDDFTLHKTSSEDFYPGSDRRRSRSKPRKRVPVGEFLQRFRRPIIGLTLAGAAAPLIQGGGTHEASAKHASPAEPTEADLARQAATDAAGKNADAEDQLASRIATEAQTTQQSSVVSHAVNKYGIDEKLAHDIYEVAQKEGIEPKLAFGLVHTESSFKPHARSWVDARGLTQVMPKTARWLMPGTKADDLWNPRTNLTLGFRYLNQLIDKYHGNVRHALLAYNRGPGTVDKILKHGGDPNNGYADKVLGG
jgi:soluble lytic murein transglycosylase-like protein